MTDLTQQQREALEALKALDKCTFSFEGRTRMQELRDIARTYILNSMPVPGWQPIETAPKDGTRILGGWLQPYTRGFCIQPVVYTPHRGWVVDWDHDIVEPTHWMPLPPKPEDRHE